ncbi:Oligopeptide-binding protein AppA precursor [Planctomycetes bacterium MalM25]|nr:Oligopeptide-binding protein AppA precursor [Planctomycetes bacterium MalM25]
MIQRANPAFALLALAAFMGLQGCGKPAAPAADSGADKPAEEATTDAPSQDDDLGPFELGDLIEPFDPPATLGELEKDIEWIDRPVIDSLVQLAERLAKEPEPIPQSEALALKNDSAENNKKILSSLGRFRVQQGEKAFEDEPGVDYDATFVRHVGGDLKSTNPLLMSSTTEFEYSDFTGIGLVSNDIEANSFAPAEIISSWQSSEDRLIDKFVIRDDLTWSDGKLVTAHDVAFTFQVIMTKAVIVPAVRTGPDELRAVVAYDDHTLVVFHKEGLATNDGNMNFPIIPKHVYEKTIPKDPTLARSEEHSRLEDNPVVAGPYELTRRARGDEFVVTRREAWHTHEGKRVRAKPRFREVRVKWIEDFNTALLAMKKGDIQEMELRPEQWTTQTNGDDFYRLNTKVTATQWTEFHFTWNQKDPLFEDERVRWAMTYAMDYEELLGTICYGLYEQCRGPFHPTSWMYPEKAPELVEQDLDKAQDLLSQAGWEDTDGDGVLDKEINGRRVPFEFTLTTYQSETGISTATLMKESLDQLGIVCNVKPTEFTVLVQKSRDHDFQGLMGGWGAGKDPSTNENIFGSDKGRNYGHYANAEVDRLFEEGKKELDPEKRAAIYGEIHTRLWKDQPCTWLFYRNAFHAFNKKIRGYNLSPWGPYYFSPGVSSMYSAAP